MEKRTSSNWQITSLILILVIISFLDVSCNERKNDKIDKIDKIDKAINLSLNSHVIKDSINYFKDRGVDFIVCYVSDNEKFDIISFNIIHYKNTKIRPYKIIGNFKIRVIQGVDILFRDFEHGNVDNNKKSEKKVKELLKKGMITFDGPPTIFEGEFLKFVFCKNNDKNFRCFNSKMSSTAERLAREEGKPYYQEVFYPKCD